MILRFWSAPGDGISVMTDGELFDMNRSERGLFIGWVTKQFENPLDLESSRASHRVINTIFDY